MTFGILKPERIERLTDVIGVGYDAARRNLHVLVPREEIERSGSFLVGHIPAEFLEPGDERHLKSVGLKPLVVDGVETAAPVAADLDIGKAALEVVGRNAVKLEKLFARPRPHRRIFGLVPDFPVFYPPLETVRPALVVMAHDVFADARPFREVLGRMDIVGLHPPVVFDGDAETVVDLRARRHYGFQIRVGERKVIVLRIGLIRVEIRKHVRHVDEMRPSPRPVGVVRAHVRDSRLFVFPDLGRVGIPQPHRRVVDAVHVLHRSGDLVEVNLHIDVFRRQKIPLQRQKSCSKGYCLESYAHLMFPFNGN